MSHYALTLGVDVEGIFSPDSCGGTPACSTLTLRARRERRPVSRPRCGRPLAGGRGVLRPGLDGWPAGGAAHGGARGADARGRALAGRRGAAPRTGAGPRGHGVARGDQRRHGRLPAGVLPRGGRGAHRHRRPRLHAPRSGDEHRRRGTHGDRQRPRARGHRPARGREPLRPGGPRQRHHRPGAAPGAR